MSKQARLLTTLFVALVGCDDSSPRPPTDAGTDSGTLQSEYRDVTTESGVVQGKLDSDADGRWRVNYFPNIPYAAPPTGANRFRPPQPVTPWTTKRSFSASQHVCPQNLPFSSMGLKVGGEDCLYLNVVTPDPMPTNAPVVVWLHGGAFVLNSGETQDNTTAGKRLADEQGVIVVTLNYRLGQLGFLAHPALAAEQGGHSGNYGMLDQLAALRWVRHNVASFGGDPSKITLYGQSAGGMSICALMASPLISDPSVVPAEDQPLFHQAILQSAPCDVPYPSQSDAEAQGQAFATAVGCTSGDVPTCLRNLVYTTVRDTMPTPNDFIRPGAGQASWGPNVDGYYMPAHPLVRIAAGTFLHVPVLGGFAEDEGNTSMHFRLGRSGSVANGIVRITSDALFDQEVNKLFEGGASAGERDAVYATAGAQADYKPATYPAAIPLNAGTDPQASAPLELTTWEQAFARIHGDMDLVCPARRTLDVLAGEGVAVHAYFTRYDNPPFQLTPQFPLGAYHNGDTQFFFGVESGGAFVLNTFTPAEETLGHTVRDYVGNFLRSGDPNGGSLLAWPAYDGSNTATQIVFDTTVTTIVRPRDAQCDVWDTLGRARIGNP